MVGKGEQAPRAAVVCFDCENFTRQGAQEAAVAAARNLRARLGEISQALGINLPVYVLFTKMDRLPFFTEYVRNLSNDEATQVLGVTLPMIQDAQRRRLRRRGDGAAGRPFRAAVPVAGGCPAGVSGARNRRRQTARLLRISARVPQDCGSRGAVPGGPVPAQPVERRAVPARLLFHRRAAGHHQRSRAGGSAAAQEQGPGGYGSAAGATGIFSAGARAPRSPSSAAPRAGGGHAQSAAVALPQPLFQRRSAGRPRRHGRQRLQHQDQLRAPHAVLIAAAVLCFIFIIWFTVSFFKNRGLEAQVRDAAHGISSTESAGADLASVDSLRKLETLRQSLETLVRVPPRRRAAGATAGASTSATISIPKPGASISTASGSCCSAQTQAGMLQ